MARSLAAGRRITLPVVGLFSDGTAVPRVGAETFRIAREVVDEIILVDTDAICAAIKDVFQDTRCILKPAGALAVAGVKAYVRRAALATQPLCGETLVAIAGGANMNFARVAFVAGRAEAAEPKAAAAAQPQPAYTRSPSIDRIVTTRPCTVT